MTMPSDGGKDDDDISRLRPRFWPAGPKPVRDEKRSAAQNGGRALQVRAQPPARGAEGQNSVHSGGRAPAGRFHVHSRLYLTRTWVRFLPRAFVGTASASLGGRAD